jgi:hypothetical protein
MGARSSQRHAPAKVRAGTEEHLLAARRHVKRVRRLKINVAAWTLGTIAFTTLWVLNQWQTNGALESFGHEGDAGQWNPTLWALAVGIWGLIVGIMALRVYFERPPTEAEIDRDIERARRPRLPFSDEPTEVELQRLSRTRLERVARLTFHVAAWVLGIIVLTPLWALIEWQDNGAFERFSNDGQPGEWEPWILYIGGVWALGIAVIALLVYRDQGRPE